MRHKHRTAAKLYRAAGGELEQIQMLLGHASVQTTERYLGTKQDLVHAPNDAIRLRGEFNLGLCSLPLHLRFPRRTELTIHADYQVGRARSLLGSAKIK